MLKQLARGLANIRGASFEIFSRRDLNENPGQVKSIALYLALRMVIALYSALRMVIALYSALRMVNIKNWIKQLKTSKDWKKNNRTKMMTNKMRLRFIKNE